MFIVSVYFDQKHIWNIQFGVQTNKIQLSQNHPAKTSLAGFGNLFKLKNGLHHCVPLIEIVKKHI